MYDLLPIEFPEFFDDDVKPAHDLAAIGAQFLALFVFLIRLRAVCKMAGQKV